MTFRFLIRLRGGLIALIYQQTVDARAVDLGSINGLTLMGTDVERIVINFLTIHEVWASLMDIIIAVFLLRRQMFLACLVPALVTFSKLSCLSLIISESHLTNALPRSFRIGHIQILVLGQGCPTSVDRKCRKAAGHYHYRARSYADRQNAWSQRKAVQRHHQPSHS